MASKIIQAHILINGRVQGIGFRWWVQRETSKLELNGWVRNLDDGRVEAIAEGEKENITKLIESIKKGPILSKVESVNVDWVKATGEFEKFGIRL